MKADPTRRQHGHDLLPQPSLGNSDTRPLPDDVLIEKVTLAQQPPPVGAAGVKRMAEATKSLPFLSRARLVARPET